MKKNKWVFFLIYGFFNFLVSYFLYIFLLSFFNYTISFSISYIFGIVLAYYLNSVFVFEKKISKKKFLLYPFIYIITYAISSVLLFIFIEVLGFKDKFSPILVTIVIFPLSYILNKFVISKN